MKILGLTTSEGENKQKINDAYLKAFTTDKTLPMVIPIFKGRSSELFTQKDQDYLNGIADNVVNVLDGLVLTGGNDLNPLAFDDKFDGSVYTNYYRDKWEATLISKFVQNGKPIIGICRGAQILGKLYGMKLTQDLIMIDKMNERHNGNNVELPSRDEPLHEVELLGDFKEWAGLDKMLFNSYHHQAFLIDDNKNVDGIEILAKTPKVIEMFGIKGLPIIGCQAHPEEMGYSYVIEYIINKHLQ